MTTETAAPVATAQATETTAPAEGQPAQTQEAATQAPADEPTTAKDFRDLVAQRLGGKAPPPKATPVAKETSATAEGQTEAQPENAQQAAAGESAEDKPESAAAVAAEDPEQAEIDRRLQALQEAGRRAGELRKQQERDAAVARREAEAKAMAEQRAPQAEHLSRILKAKESGDPLAVLSELGYADPEEQGRLLVNALNRLAAKAQGQPVTEQGEQGLTAEQIKALAKAEARAELEAEQAKRKADDEKAKAEQQQAAERQLAHQRNVFFGELDVEYKGGDFPAIAAEGITHAGIDAYYGSLRAKDPGLVLKPRELLERLETDLTDRAERIVKARAAHAVKKQGAVAIPPKTTTPPPSGKPRTVTPAMASSEPREPAKPKTLQEKNDEFKARVVSQWH